MSEYYEVGRPFSRENWNKLIRDLNENLANAPGGCEGISPLDEVDPEHIWTKQDVEEVRDKIKEMCEDNEFGEDLNKPWRKAIIDEIEEQMNHWCDCRTGPFLIHTAIPQLDGCNFDPKGYISLSSLINGLGVCNSGYDGDWTVTQHLWHYYTGGVKQVSRVASGVIDCSGSIVYTGDTQIPEALWVDYFCYTYGCTPGAWLCWFLGQEWCDAYPAICEAEKAERQQVLIDDAQNTVDEWTAAGYKAEYWLSVSCRAPKYNNCGGGS
jgi:hypothetical protein